MAAATAISIGDFVSECLLNALREIDVLDMRADFFPDKGFQVLAFPEVNFNGARFFLVSHFASPPVW
jgi:hypothetical protein